MTAPDDLALNAEFGIIEDILREVYAEIGVQIAMQSRNRMLAMRSPADLLEHGEYQRVFEWASRLADGNF